MTDTVINVIHDASKGYWYLIQDGVLLDWNNPEWIGLSANFPLPVVTKDEDNNQLTTVTFRSEANAVIASACLNLHRDYITDLHEIYKWWDGQPNG